MTKGSATSTTVTCPRCRHLLNVVALALVLLAALAALPGASAQNAPRNGAGLIVRHGDGALVYAYVEFDAETISGEELLLRSGLDLVVAPFGGLGTAVCAINGEGCPADDCFCESFSSPAYYWHYFARTADGWAVNPRGPLSHQLADGDIDGWSWTSGEHGLPPVTIEEIATLTGFDRSPEPTATPTIPPTEIPTPSPTSAPLPSPTSTSTQPAPPTPTATDAPANSATPPLAAPTTSPTRPPPVTASPTVTVTSSRAPTQTAMGSAEEVTSAPTTTAENTPTASSGTVLVRPGATPEALARAAGGGGIDSRDLMLFGGFVTLVLAAGTFAVVRRRGGLQ